MTSTTYRRCRTTTAASRIGIAATTSEPYLSVFVVNALAHAKAKGFAVTQAVLDRAKPYLVNIEQHYPSYYPKEVRWAISAYALYTRKQLGDVDIAKGQRLFKEGGLDHMTIETDGWLLGLFAQNYAQDFERVLIWADASTLVGFVPGPAGPGLQQQQQHRAGGCGLLPMPSSPRSPGTGLPDQVTGAPIEGATVCANGLAGPPVRDHDGRRDVLSARGVPGGQGPDSALVTTADGYLGRENDMAEDSAAPDYFWGDAPRLFSTAAATTLLSTHAGFTYPSSTTGFVEVIRQHGVGIRKCAERDRDFSPAGPTGAAVDGGSDADATPDLALTATPGNAGDGLIYFGDLDAGHLPDHGPIRGRDVHQHLWGGSTINGEWPPVGSTRR